MCSYENPEAVYQAQRLTPVEDSVGETSQTLVSLESGGSFISTCYQVNDEKAIAILKGF